VLRRRKAIADMRSARGSQADFQRIEIEDEDEFEDDERGILKYAALPTSELQPNGLQIVVSGKIGWHRTGGRLKWAIDRCP